MPQRRDAIDDIFLELHNSREKTTKKQIKLLSLEALADNADAERLMHERKASMMREFSWNVIVGAKRHTNVDDIIKFREKKNTERDAFSELRNKIHLERTAGE
jgi:hypothetical protein